jgi:LCP family protein required for cell wall assembly
VGSGAIGVNLLVNHYENRITRQDIFANVPQGERVTAAPVTGPMNILLLGSDNAAGKRGREGVRGQRSDTLMLLHVSRGFDHVVVVSIQRDSYVDVPAVPGWPGGKSKITEALDLGGPALALRTVQDLLGIDIAHVAVVSFEALHKATDAVGGVDVYVDQPVYDKVPRQNWSAGWHHLDGQRAEAYVRQRTGLPASDYDRMKRQQQYIRALVKKATSSGVLTDPFKLDALLNAVTSSITVDKDMPVKELAFAARNIRLKNVTFATMPTLGLLRLNGTDYEQVDTVAAQALGRAINTDDFGPYFAAFPPNDATHGF